MTWTGGFPLPDGIFLFILGKQNWNIRSVSEVAVFSREAGRHFISNFGFYCIFQHDDAGIFKCFCFIWELWISWGRYQLQSEFTRSNKQPCGRRDIEFIWQFTALSFQILLNLHWKMWKTVALACKLLKSLSKRPWSSSTDILLSLFKFSMPDEGGEKRIYQFLRFSVYQFMDLKKGTRELTQF